MPERTRTWSTGAVSLLVTTLVAACSSERGGPEGRLAVDVSPLSLSEVDNAVYTIAVHAGPAGAGPLVWTRTVSADQYGDGQGAITYVGPCDASAGVHTVTLTLDALYVGGSATPSTDYIDPTPVALEATCAANADVAVRFDITLMRQADQGFFDVAVNFEDIFCSAKLDCQTASGADLELLHHGTDRDLTAVLGFACAGGPLESTFLYMDDVVIDCANLAQDVIVSPAGLGLVTPIANPGGYLFAAAVYRGITPQGVAYWNTALGLDAATFEGAGACTLRARATASSEAWPQEPLGFPLPPATIYPVVSWSVPLSDDAGPTGRRVCGTHPLGSPEVAVDYAGYLPLANAFTWGTSVERFEHRLEPGPQGGTVLSAGAPSCNPSCARGTCVDLGGGPACDCTGTGYGGPTCAVPVCDSPCQNGGLCVAPNVCQCASGFSGPSCADDIDECQTSNGGCAQTCTNTVGSFVCACDPGYALANDGFGCDDLDECATDNGGCSVNATCTNTPGSRTCGCNAGYSGDGITCTDIDECLTNHGGCSANATCTNTVGSRTCGCNSGYSGDGITCTDINECLTNHGGCSANATCTNTPGSRTCGCNSGYSGDGITCNDIDECLTNHGGCSVNATCTNTVGSRTCGCNAGYSGDGITCTDINECLTNNGGCPAGTTCTNSPGSFSCPCSPGLVDPDGDGACAEINDCYDILRASPSLPSGTYTIDPDGAGPATPFQVYCDQTTDGGGWTLVLNQINGTFYHLKSANAELTSPTVAGGHTRIADLLPNATEIRTTDTSGTTFLNAYINGAAYWSAMQIANDSSPVAVAYQAGPLAGALRYIEVRDVFHWGHRHNVQTVDGVTTSVKDIYSDPSNCLHTCWEDVNTLDRAFAGDHCNSATTPSFCPATAANYTFPASSTRGGTFNYRKWVRSRPPATCLEWRVLGYSTSGSFQIDPDGNGPIAPLMAYCDMTFDGGGWTLIRSTLSTDCLGTEGPVARGAAGYLPNTTMLALANRGTQVHIRTRDQQATRSATSVRNALAITKLRASRMVNEGMTLSSAGAPTADGWSGPMVPSQMWMNCNVANIAWPSVYHACGNGGGLHFIGNTTQCGWADQTRENMELYVR